MIEPSAFGVDRRRADGPEAGLIRGLREGSSEAYAELRRRFGRTLYQYAAARLMGEVSLAEELAICALAEATLNIRRYVAARSSLSTWLFGIMRRQVQRELARRKRRKAIPPWAQIPLEVVAETPARGDLSSESAGRVDAQRQVAAIAKELSDLEFEVLVLSCVEELSAPEIAQIVARSERAIHSLLHRARQKARKRLKQDEPQ